MRFGVCLSGVLYSEVNSTLAFHYPNQNSCNNHQNLNLEFIIFIL
jgi:hypothetical protein